MQAVRNSDDRFRSLSRELQLTSDPIVAGRLLFESVRLGRWIDGTYRVGTFRFLAYLGWNEASGLLEGQLKLKTRGPMALAEMVDLTVLSASAAASCMAVRHLLPFLNAQHGLSIYERAIASQVSYKAGESKEELEARWRSESEAHYFAKELTGSPLPCDDRRLSWREVYDGVSASSAAVHCAKSAWSELLCAPQARPDYRAGHYVTVIVDATHALAWERMHAYEGRRPPIARRQPGAHGSGRVAPSIRCMNAAKKALREAMLAPALVAAATLVC